MAKKKKAVLSPLQDIGTRDAVMTAAQIANAQKLLAQIGNGTISGIVLVAKIKTKSDTVETTGCSFINQVSPAQVADTVISSFKLPKLAWLMNLSRSIIEEPDHEHDAEGNCLR